MSVSPASSDADRPARVEMPVPDVVDRLASLPSLADIPREELVWLAEHGHVEVHPPGTLIAPKGVPIEYIWVILSGHMAIRVDRGAGPRRVFEWRTGEVSGMLPYSRMTSPPGDNFLEETCELLVIHEDHFPEMVRLCPRFTAYTVHQMLDRARGFNASALQDEKMISLGKLAAGLAHELNNPASAMIRASKLLVESTEEADAATLLIHKSGLPSAAWETIERVRSACLDQAGKAPVSSLARADLEEEIAEWLDGHGSDLELAGPLTDAGVTVDQLNQLAEVISGGALNAALRRIAAGCSTRSLARTIEQAATRTHELVSAVKRFTYMDNLVGPELVDVEAGLRDTVRVLDSKARDVGATISLDVDPDLPQVPATGSELNQVWMNLIDNALDAVTESGHVEITAGVQLDRVVVRIIDDGSGIPEDVLSRIFDPFFTTKPPGQGVGLGLDITRRLLRRHHGEVSVQSRPGRTEFQVSLVTGRPTTVGGDSGSSP